VSTRDLEDDFPNPFEDAARKYFKESAPRPSIAETAAYYRARKMASTTRMLTVILALPQSFERLRHASRRAAAVSRIR
jgi:hypothetical protein